MYPIEEVLQDLHNGKPKSYEPEPIRLIDLDDWLVLTQPQRRTLIIEKYNELASAVNMLVAAEHKRHLI